jgi:hypothetical protein
MHFCKICNYYASSNYLIKKHYNTQKHINKIESIAEFECTNCNKKFKYESGLLKHQNSCIQIIQNKFDNNFENKTHNNETDNIELEKYKLEIKVLTMESQIQKFEIEKLKQELVMLKYQNKQIDEIIRNNKIMIISDKLFIDTVEIMARNEDKYINATQLCNVCNKSFDDWCKLDNVKEMISYFSSISGITISKLIDNSDCQQIHWVHPELAIILAQWLSPKIGLHVSKWTKTLNEQFDEGLLKKLKDMKSEDTKKETKIKMLEDMFVKKHKRQIYPDNVIYILTTKEIKDKGIYIIGQASKLSNTLSTYNKISEHEVIYYKECKSYQDMNIIKKIIITKLECYKEKANRDRLFLPNGKHISLFTDVIDQVIESYN